MKKKINLIISIIMYAIAICLMVVPMAFKMFGIIGFDGLIPFIAVSCLFCAIAHIFMIKFLSAKFKVIKIILTVHGIGAIVEAIFLILFSLQ